MKKSFLVPLIILLVSVIIFGGCAKPAPAPAPAPTPAPAPAPAPVKPIELKFSHFLPPVVWFVQKIYGPWAKEIEERTNGRVKITQYPAEALAKVTDQYPTVLSGMADIAAIDVGAHPGIFPLTEGTALPLIFKTTEASCGAWYESAEKYLMDAEYKKVKLLWVQSVAPAHLMMGKKLVRTLEDFPGLKMTSTVQGGLNAFRKLGATPVGIAVTDLYTSLERGLVDGCGMPWESIHPWRLLEVTKAHTTVGLYTVPLMVVMNLDAWNSLPPDIKQVFEDTTGLKLSLKHGTQWDTEDEYYIGEVIKWDQEHGNPEVYFLPEAERARWREAVTPQYEEWIAETEAKGLPARAFFNDLLQLAAKYDK